MTEREKVMYEIIGNISDSNIPLVFKGGLIMKLVLSENGFEKIERMTKDIDASWVGEPPTMQEMADSISRCLETMDGDYIAVPGREYGEHRSAGISIIERSTGDEIASMDIDVKPSLGVKKYYAGEISIKGVLSDEILMDKISALSGKAPFKRTKDMIDIYALSRCVEIKTKNIFTAFQKAEKICGDFLTFNERKDDLKHSYNKLNILKGKPPFEEVYIYLQQLFKPFEEKNVITNMIWNSDTVKWDNVIEREKNQSEEKSGKMGDYMAEINKMRQSNKNTFLKEIEKQKSDKGNHLER